MFLPTVLSSSNRFVRALQQNRAQSRLLYLFNNKESVKFPTHYFQFSKQILIPKRTTVSQHYLYSHKTRYNKPIRILVINISNNLIGCTRLKLSKMSNHQGSKTINVHIPQLISNLNNLAGRIQHFCLKFFSLLYRIWG